MPSYRIGFGSDFNLRDAKVGIGTTLGRTKLDVAGVSKADFNIAGVSTLTSYGGFVGQKQNVSVASTIGFSTSGVGTFVSVDESETGYLNLSGDFNTVSEDIIVDEGKIFQVSSGSTVSVGTLESVSIGTHFSVPNGGISARPDEPREGMVRFNDDLNTLEFYNGVEWRQFTVTGASGRGVFGGGGLPGTTHSNIDVINISTLGNSVYFGNLNSAKYASAAASSSTRGLFAGGNPITNVIEYVTIASSGNAIDFGDLTDAAGKERMGGASSSTRAVFAGGRTPTQLSEIDYVEISTIGNALNFGDLRATYRNQGSCSSPVRGFFAGGSYDPVGNLSQIEYITIASTGNSIEFGDLTQIRSSFGGCSNSTRGVFGGGLYFVSPTNYSSKVIDYISLQSLGNAISFGELIESTDSISSCSNSVRGIFGGGYRRTPASGGDINVIQYITITSEGNAIDFGDLSIGGAAPASCSDSHGGLGGF